MFGTTVHTTACVPVAAWNRLPWAQEAACEIEAEELKLQEPLSTLRLGRCSCFAFYLWALASMQGLVHLALQRFRDQDALRLTYMAQWTLSLSTVAFIIAAGRTGDFSRGIPGV